MNNKFIINIAGDDYTILTEETREYTDSVAKIVDDKIKNMPEELSRNQKAILTAVQIADEMQKDKMALSNIRIQMKEYIDEVEYLRNELGSVRRTLATERRL